MAVAEASFEPLPFGGGVLPSLTSSVRTAFPVSVSMTTTWARWSATVKSLILSLLPP